MAAQHLTAKKDEQEKKEEEQEAPTQAEDGHTQDRPNFKPASWRERERERERERLELLAFLSWALTFTAWPPSQDLPGLSTFFLTFLFFSRPATAHRPL